MSYYWNMSTGEPGRTALAGDEVDRRKTALALLRDALTAFGIDSVLVGRRILMRPGADPAWPAKAGDPELHVLGAGHCHVVTADGECYRFADDGTHAVGD